MSEKEKKKDPDHKTKNKTVVISQKEYESLKKCTHQASDDKDELLRAQAEFENIKKRLEKEKQDFLRFANEALIADLLMVLDDLGRSIELAQKNKEDFPAFLKGIELVLGQLYEILKKRGLEPIQTEGKVFDPHFHEALLNVEDDALPDHSIVEELQRGYLLSGRIIRTAKVKITKKTGK